MSNSIEVSIIIPVLNQKKRIEECITSLLQQQYDSACVEIIVIDNGSTDGTWELLKNFPGIITKQISHTKSPYVCRNKGVEFATKEWLLFLDSKIIIKGSDWLQNFTSVDPNPNKIYFARILPDTLILSASQWCEMISIMDYNLLSKSGINGVAGCFMVNKKTFLKVGLYRLQRSGGDTEWSQLAISKGFKGTTNWEFPVYYIPKKHTAFQKKIVRFGLSDREYYLNKDGSGVKFFWHRILEMRPPNPFRIYNILKSENLHKQNAGWYLKIIFTTWYYRIYQKLITLNLINGTSD
jgi:glycosyltransferase involved in cell wall biosynthesis